MFFSSISTSTHTVLFTVLPATTDVVMTKLVRETLPVAFFVVVTFWVKLAARTREEPLTLSVNVVVTLAVGRGPAKEANRGRG